MTPAPESGLSGLAERAGEEVAGSGEREGVGLLVVGDAGLAPGLASVWVKPCSAPPYMFSCQSAPAEFISSANR